MKFLRSLITNTVIIVMAFWLCLFPTLNALAQQTDSGMLYLVYRNGVWGYA